MSRHELTIDDVARNDEFHEIAKHPPDCVVGGRRRTAAKNYQRAKWGQQQIERDERVGIPAQEDDL